MFSGWIDFITFLWWNVLATYPPVHAGNPPGNSPSKSNDASLPLEFGRKITTSRNTFPIPGVLVFWFQFRLCSSFPGAEKRAKQQTRQDRKAHLERARAHRVLLVVMLASVRVFMFLIMRRFCARCVAREKQRLKRQ